MEVLQLSWHFVLAVLATWRVTHLLAAEDGPGDIVVRFRALLGQSFAGRLMDCFYCLSIWIAAPAALFVTRHWLDWIMVWLAVSGAACLLERLGQQPAGLQTPVSQSDDQLTHGGIHSVLRTETNGAQEEPNRYQQIQHEPGQYEPETISGSVDFAPDPDKNAHGFRAPTSSPHLRRDSNSIAPDSSAGNDDANHGPPTHARRG
jgi:hypothetical protein